jgi:hypothetical protein
MTCEDCIWNDDGICDKYGTTVDDDDKACRLYEKEDKGHDNAR